MEDIGAIKIVFYILIILEWIWTSSSNVFNYKRNINDLTIDLNNIRFDVILFFIFFRWEIFIQKD